WRIVLEKLGHEVSYLAGNIGGSDGYSIPEFSLDFKPALLIRKNAFVEFSDFNSQEEFETAIVSLKDRVKQKIQRYIEKSEIEFLITNNMFSLPMNIPASLALIEVIKENNLKGISHNHDFYWERVNYKPTVAIIQNYLDDIFPPKIPNIRHVVINSLAQKALKQRKGIDAKIIPNVCYFNGNLWKKDTFNSDLQKRLKIDSNDIFILQATRIIQRKGIELAIDLIKELNKEENLRKLRKKPLYDGRNFGRQNKIVLVMPNLIEDFKYKEKIESKLKDSSVEYRFCHDIFANNRSLKPEKKYSLWDSYVYADIVTYPSLQEGWGNQFLEAIEAKRPIVVFEYGVYKVDIEPNGFETISLGSTIEGYDENDLVKVRKEIIVKAAEKVIHFLQDSEFRKRIVKNNYSIGKEKFSLQALEKYIKPLVVGHQTNNFSNN
ncbi:MAG: glycosyltransferase family 4 protein, partial [Candidatus Hodarchaeales archaeon]